MTGDIGSGVSGSGASATELVPVARAITGRGGTVDHRARAVPHSPTLPGADEVEFRALHRPI